MKLTTKRNRRYFWREFFSYIIPIILIVGTVDVFYNFMRCPLHPEWSAPCSVNWIIGIMYGVPLILVIILAIISANRLRKVKKQIENEVLENVNRTDGIEKESQTDSNFGIIRQRKVIVKSDKKESTEKITKKKIEKNDSKKEDQTPIKRKTTKK